MKSYSFCLLFHMFSLLFSCKGIVKATMFYNTSYVCKSVPIWKIPIEIYIYIGKFRESPVTITGRMLARRKSSKTSAVSGLSLFCMIVRPRNSMLVSMWSLLHTEQQSVSASFRGQLAQTWACLYRQQRKTVWEVSSLEPVEALHFMPG